MIAILLLLAGSPGAAQIIAVDDSDGAPAYTETGQWSTTSNTGAGYNGTLYRFTRSTSAPSTATWTPNIPEQGAYEVFAVFRRGGDRTSLAPYTINHLDGSNIVNVDQTGSFGGDLGMASLGSYQFEAGTSGSVTLSNNGGPGVYIADAVLFVPDAPPVIGNVRHAPLYPQAADTVTVTARVVDNGGVDFVRVNWSAEAVPVSGQEEATAGPGDVYTATIPPQPDGVTVTYSIEAGDALGSVTTSATYQYVVGGSGTWELLINEVMASNTFTVNDPDFGEAGDWIELYNVGPDIADLSGLALSDNLNNPTKWLFPPGIALAAGDYLLVWCDGYDTVGEAIHTSFRLSAEAEDAVLYDPVAEQIIDSISWTDLGTDESLARIPNLTGEFQRTIVPTPGAPNEFALRGDAPRFSHASGFYSEAIMVEISAPGATEIRYTTDASTPGTTSFVYTEPIPVSGTMGLRARAYYSDMSPSQVTTASYFFTFVANREIPIMNLVIDPDHLYDPATGIYVNFTERGLDWERPVHVSVFSPDGSVHENIDAGIRIHGGSSRATAKKSFRLYFRNLYGENTWSLPWLENAPGRSIRHLVLRGGANDGFLVGSASQLQEVTFIRDQIIRDWLHKQGNYAADGFFAALYLNGQYWGIYNITERITEDQMAEVFGGTTDYDVVKGGWTFETKYFTDATDGDMVAWEEFLEWHENSDLRQDDDFEELKRRIDYENFLEFFALNIACQNEDWPHNNWIATRHRLRPDDKWVFHEWDAEWALGLRPQGWESDTIQWARGSNFHLSPSHNGTVAPLCALFSGNHLDPNRTRTIYGILDNPQGRRDFIAALEDVLNFELVPANAISDFDAYVDAIRTEVPREAARWASSSSANEATLNSNWNAAVGRVRQFLQNRPTYIRNLTESTFSLQGRRTITFQAAGEGAGRMIVRGRVVELPWTGTFFDASDVQLSAIADYGSNFISWSGLFDSNSADVVHTAQSGSNATVTITFSDDGPAYLPNDVIFNEYWVNDDGTFYETVNAPISRDWFELLVVRDGVDMRGWRVTTNPTMTTIGSPDEGSIIFPDLPVLSNLPAGTIILVVSSQNEINDSSFPEDELDLSNRRLIFYAGNGNLDLTTDPGFGIGTNDQALVLLAPGASSSFEDDIGVDFIAEGFLVTPASFFETGDPPLVFFPPFEGIGGDDGAVFQNDPTGGFNNDDGSDPDRTDFLAGPGGWVVDPPAIYTGDSDPFVENRLTPGAPNWGQDIITLLGVPADAWMFY